MKSRLSRRIDFRTDIAARDWVYPADIHPPFAEGNHVRLVEFAKALLGKLPGRTQLAGAERRKRPAGRLGDRFDSSKALHQRRRRAKAVALYFEARGRRN